MCMKNYLHLLKHVLIYYSQQISNLLLSTEEKLMPLMFAQEMVEQYISLI